MANIIDEIRQNSKEPELISRAFDFAKKHHEGQKRFSGEDYVFHPLRTARTLSRIKLDSKTIIAALLHDTIDDTPATLEEIEKFFGKEVAFLVDGVSKLGKIRFSKENLVIRPIKNLLNSPLNLEAENLRKIFFAMAKDIRVILIKLADRLDNTETLNYIPKEKQKRFALETLEVFAPVADRLGMGDIKGRLEDLTFPYLYPKEYDWLMKSVEKKYSEREHELKKFVPTLKEIIEKETIKIIDIHSRPKHYFSLYQKLLKYEMDFGKIYDLVAARIVVEDVKTCYQVLGIIHKNFQPLMGRIKDYIAIPKPNGYQSLHTTIFSNKGQIIEIQIRTPEMHKEAEYGICAHWAAKEKIDLKFQQKKFAWVNQLREWQKDILSPEEFLEGLKFDFFEHRIFVFTPKGDVIDLPEGACAIDFAYAVHSNIGDHCSGAKINGKLLTVSTKLKNGDIVEILVDKNKKPSRDWLKFVKTGFARNQIKKETKGFFQNLTEKFLPQRIKTKILQIKDKKEISNIKQKKALMIEIGGETGIYFSLAKCCKPKAGERIKALLTKRKGASVHSEDCKTIKKLLEKSPERIISATWKEQK